MDDEAAATMPFRVLHPPSHDQMLGEILAQTRVNESEIMMLRGTTAEHTIILSRIEQAIAESRRGPGWWYAGMMALMAAAVSALCVLVWHLVRISGGP